MEKSELGDAKIVVDTYDTKMRVKKAKSFFIIVFFIIFDLLYGKVRKKQ
jgi:hypothetical protein